MGLVESLANLNCDDTIVKYLREGTTMSSGYQKVTNELDVKVIDTEKKPTATQRTEAAIKAGGDAHGAWDRDRVNQARSFVTRAKKSDAKRKREKAARKANRRRK